MQLELANDSVHSSTEKARKGEEERMKYEEGFIVIARKPTDVRVLYPCRYILAV